MLQSFPAIIHIVIVFCYLKIDIHSYNMKGRIISSPSQMSLFSYKFIALPPNAPSTAEATAMTIFKILSQRDLLTAITLHTSFPTL